MYVQCTSEPLFPNEGYTILDNHLRSHTTRLEPDDPISFRKKINGSLNNRSTSKVLSQQST